MLVPTILRTDETDNRQKRKEYENEERDMYTTQVVVCSGSDGLISVKHPKCDGRHSILSANIHALGLTCGPHDRCEMKRFKRSKRSRRGAHFTSSFLHSMG